MDYAENYRWSVAPFTKPVVISVLEEFRSMYVQKGTCDNEGRTALDIGFGDGSVTAEVIRPFLPASTRLDGADKSEDMIRFVKKCYGKQDYKFFFWDVEEKILDESLVRSYDHVFSFFCFHYVINPRLALRNIYDILKPNGNVILAFIPNLSSQATFKTLSLNPKWSSYMRDVDTLCPKPFEKENSPHKVFAELMSECGFKNVITRLDAKHVLFDSWERLEGQMRYLDIFSQRMPLELQEEYFAAVLATVKQIDGFWTEKYNDSGELVGVLESCEVLIAYGEKCSQ